MAKHKKKRKASSTKKQVKKKNTPSLMPEAPPKKTGNTHNDAMPKAPLKNNLRRNRKRRQKRRMTGGFLAFILCLVLLILIFLGINRGFNRWGNSMWDALFSKQLSDEVLEYKSDIEAAAEAYGIPEYSDIIMCMMMQESGGQGNDPMQSSECQYNTRYEQVPHGIQDPLYSIDCGVSYFDDCIREAGCTGPEDENALMMALQGYNFGTGYIHWALDYEGGWSKKNAKIFSENMASELGWSSYGDPNYAPNVMLFYRTLKESSDG